MRTRVIVLLLATTLALGGCSAYYRQDTETSAGTEIVRIETSGSEETEAGPGRHEFSPDDMTIESLELPSEDSEDNNPEIVIATDIHYLAKELTDFGQAFVEMEENGDGKVVSYVWEITDAFLDEVIERRPQALILLGDLSLNGELLSHEALAQKLEKVERAGIDVAVIPGNHDINNTAAAGYQGDSIVPAETTTPELFVSVYGAYGYEEAVSRDPASLSYVYELDDGTWLFMLDSCQYEKNAQIGGMIRTDTYEWMEEWLEKGWSDKRNMIAVAHHNLLDESRIYQENCTIEHAEQLEQLLADWDVSLFLSGHLHVQHYRTSQDYDIQEIVTSALSISPCQYGVLKYFGPDTFDYHTVKVNMAAWAQRKDDPDVNLQDFEVYADAHLQDVYYRKAFRELAGKVTREQAEMMADYYAIMNAYSVSGTAVEVLDWAEAEPARAMWQEFNRTDILSMYLDEIIEDAVCDYNTFQKQKQ